MTYKTGSWGKDAKERSIRRRKYFRQERLVVIQKLGEKCAYCGIKDDRVLQIDHKDGGGGKEWSKLSSRGRYKIALKEPNRFQILCANCNTLKRYLQREVRQQKAG